MKTNSHNMFIILAFMVCCTLLFSSCTRPKAKDVSVAEVIEKLADNAEIPSMEKDDLTDKENAEKFMLSTDDFTEGMAVYSSTTEQADKIILVKAKDKKTVQDVERALADVLNGLKNTWESDDVESKKVDEHILKTRDTYVLLYVGQKNEEAEEIFDSSLS